jgi:hypothetical protein
LLGGERAIDMVHAKSADVAPTLIEGFDEGAPAETWPDVSR